MKSIGPNVSSLTPTPGALESRGPSNRANGVSENAFREQLQALRDTKPSTAPTGAVSSLKFSNHAIDRMQARGIRFSPEQMARIESAIDKAASKGAKNTLLLSDESALIVSVKDKTVVTVMDKANLKENVFTNIDSTVMI